MQDGHCTLLGNTRVDYPPNCLLSGTHSAKQTASTCRCKYSVCCSALFEIRDSLGSTRWHHCLTRSAGSVLQRKFNDKSTPFLLQSLPEQEAHNGMNLSIWLSCLVRGGLSQ